MTSNLTFRSATYADLDFIVGLIIADSVTPSADRIGDPAYAAALREIDADPNQ